MVKTLMELRFEKYKERMIEDPSDVVRGRALELRDMLKLFVDTKE